MKKLMVLAVLGAFLVAGQAFANKRGHNEGATGEDTQTSKRPCIRGATNKTKQGEPRGTEKKDKNDKKAEGLE